MPETTSQPSPDELHDTGNSSEYAQLADSRQDDEPAHGAVIETGNTVSYLGVELERGTGNEKFVPHRNANYINDQFSLQLQQEMAMAFKVNQPILLEGGTSLGKTTTAQKMCAELGWSWHYSNNTGSSEVETMMGSYLPNPDRHTDADPEFSFVDGPVMAAIREAQAGNKVMLVIDELNSTQPNILIRLHEVLDAYEKSQTMSVAEGGNDKIQLVRENLNIVGLTNPPSRSGSHYLGREALDPAQIRRWVYRKLPDELPKDSMEYSTRALFGLETQTPDAEPSDYVYSAEHKLPRSEVANIPGIDDMVILYQEFHHQAKAMLREHKIGEDQPQKFTYDDREEPRRVMEFVQSFYRGDINETFQEALNYYYTGKLLDPNDRAKLGEIIKTVEYIPRTGDRRRGLDRREAAPAPTPFPVIEAWSNSPQGTGEMAAYLENPDLIDKISKSDWAESLAGVDTQWDFLKELERVLEIEGSETIGRAIAGSTHFEAWRMRDRLVDRMRWTALGESLVGIDDRNADRYRTSLKREGTKESLNAAMTSLAGLDTAAHWLERDALVEHVRASAFALSTTGLTSERAWEVRHETGMLSRANANSLGMSLAGLDTPEAWDLREQLSEKGRHDSVAYSLAGLDTERAWAKRSEVAGVINPSILALSVGGLNSQRAWDYREDLETEDNANPAAIAKGVNGNWVMAGVMRARHEAGAGHAFGS